MFATLSILLLFALVFVLVWCLIIYKRRKKKWFPSEQQFLISDQNLSAPTFIPNTVPKIVQTAVSRPSNHSHPLQFPLAGVRSYRTESTRSVSYANSCKSEPAINYVSTMDDKTMSRALPRHKHPYLWSSGQLNGTNYKFLSRQSSRGSSFKSEDFDIDHRESAIQSKDVYIHSSLIQAESPECEDKEGQFVPDDHLISYDQETDEKDTDSTHQKGALMVSLYYDLESSELNVVVRQAINLPLVATKEEDLDVYVNFCLVPEDFYWQRTISVQQTRNPMFNQTFQIFDVLHHKLRQYTICFLVMGASGFQEMLLGKVMIPLSELRGGIEVEMCRELGE